MADSTKTCWEIPDDSSLLVGLTFRARTGRNRVSVGVDLPLGRGRNPDVPRGTIGEFSRRSRARLYQFLCDCYPKYLYMGTLTVADDVLLAEDFKRALDRFLVWLMREQRRRAEDPAVTSCLWFLEFQRRGAPHVHLFYTTFIPWKSAAASWARAIDQPWAFQTSTKFEQIRTGRRGSIAYAAKYASKTDQKALPDDVTGFGRWWGIRGYRATMAADMLLRVNSENADFVAKVLHRITEVAKGGVAASEAKAVPWKMGNGLLLWNNGPEWDAFLAVSGWRALMEIQFSKLAALEGFAIIRDPVEVEDAGFFG